MAANAWGQPEPSSVMQVVGRLAAAAPCAWLAGRLIAVWVDPHAYGGGEWVRAAIALFAFELVLVGCGVFMANAAVRLRPGPRRWTSLAGFAALFGVLALGFALVDSSSGILRVYAAVVVGRFASLVALDTRAAQDATADAVRQALVLLGLVLATVIVPAPALGLTDAVLASLWPERPLDTVWSAHPERALAAAALYFGGYAASQLWAVARRR